MSEEPDLSRWHLDKRVNIGHMIATLMLAAALFSWASAIKEELAVLKEKAAQQKIIDDKQDANIERNLGFIRDEFRIVRDELREQGKKIDKLVERGGFK